MRAKHILQAALLCASLAANAQTGGCNSSYSRFGLGTLSDASSSNAISMGGTGVALRSGSRINTINPASYSVCDSMVFIIDAGMTMQCGSYSTTDVRKNVFNSNVGNVSAMFRMRRGLGMVVGFEPFTSIGYKFLHTETVGWADLSGALITSTSTYKGDGGMHNLFVGAGWTPFRGMSIGANIGYLCGTYNHTITQAYMEGSSVSSVYDGLHASYSADLKSYKADVGVQYSLSLPKKNTVVLGATMGVGHRINGDVNMMRYTTNGDTVSHTMPNAFDLPWSAGAGVAYYNGSRWIATADYRVEMWDKCRMPQIDGHAATAVSQTGLMMRRQRISAGLEFTPDIYRSFIHRCSYRAGFSYGAPYYKVNGHDGPSEYTLSVGMGIPIINRWNNRSVLNLGLQWAHIAPSQKRDITENYFRLNVGITFNEWLMKWKIR